MNEKIIKKNVFNLAGFVNIMEKLNYENFYFRGESKEYPNRMFSSLFRDYKNSDIKLDEIYTNLITEYYRNIGNRISDIEKNNFLAFSQHHGLKTNLVDFSASPIVSLYFACDTDKNCSDDDMGYVYLLDKEKCMNASKIISRIGNPDKLRLNYFNDFSLNIHEFANMIDNYINTKENYFQYYAKNLLIFSNIFKSIKSNLSTYKTLEYLKSYVEVHTKQTEETLSSGELRDEFDIFEQKFIEEADLEELKCLFHTRRFALILKQYFSDIQTTEFTGENINFVFPEMPYMLFQTPVKFDRIENQEGIFIYQSYFHYFDPNIQKYKAIFQHIKPNIVIKIHNQRQILNELDSIGINRKYIYGDYDNISRYLNEKFLKNII